MNHFKHRLCNAALWPATGDEENTDVLHVMRDNELVPNGDEARCVRSFWRPTPEELKHLEDGGCVVLTVLAQTHAPLRLDVMPRALC